MGWRDSIQTRRRRAVVVLAVLTLVACSSSDGGQEREPPDGADELLVPAPAIPPRPADTRALDGDGNRLDDVLDAELASIRRDLAGDEAALNARLDGRVKVEAIFDRPLRRRDVDLFLRSGGSVTYVHRAVSYGFVGTLPRRALAEAARLAGPELRLLEADRAVEHHLDEATRTGRVRPIWAAGFSGGGYAGAADINIAIMDTGLDGTHPDLAGRSVGWKDYTAEDSPSPIDVEGHGSHVAGIALGSGAAFGVGPGPLRWTDSGDLTGRPDGDFLVFPVHLPSSFDVTSTATWVGAGTSTLSLRKQADGASGSYTTVSIAPAGVSPLSLSFTGTSSNERFLFAVTQSGSLVGRFAAANTVTSYPAVGDGFPAMRGVASGSGWYGAKIFPVAGAASALDIGKAIDDIVVKRTSLNIKVCNMSFGILGGGVDTGLRAKTNTMVDNGIVVVASNGNNGSAGVTADPGRAANAITVGSTNDVNQLTQYTSAGSTGSGSGDDDKPDLLAPGGSAFRSKILSVDSNSADAANASFADVRPNDYTNVSGTSMAAPFIAGSAALVIEALQRAGAPWSFTGPSSPLRVKMLLLASATETNAAREVGTGSPTLGRGAAPRDLLEGHGIVNPDAAIEAATVSFSDFSGSTTGATTDRRAWGRQLTVPAGKTVRLDLAVPGTGDFDVHLYASQPSSNGTPIQLGVGDSGGIGQNESVFFTAQTTTTIHVIVKRISGSGTFSISSVLFTCGNGAVETGEQCDDGNAVAGDCCTPFCQLIAAGTTCNDGNACTQTDVCNDSGVCTGTNPVLCTASDACHAVGTCSTATGLCDNPPKPNGSPCTDNNACTQSDSCQAGVCVGSNPVQCGAVGSCSEGGSCDPATGACSSAHKPNGTPCDDGNACSQSDTCQAGACVGGNPVVCPPPDECHVAACNVSGTCVASAKNDGSPCSVGACLSGVCTAPVDAGVPFDAGTSIDAGIEGGSLSDAGVSDGGADAGSGVDAGVRAPVDAGARPDTPDASIVSPAVPVTVSAPINEVFVAGGGGCDCSTGPTSPTSPLSRVALAGLVVVTARLRRRTRKNQPV